MSKINTNVSSLIAQNNLSKSNNDLATRLQRLSTGLKINRGADDPAGLIVSERLRSEMSGIDQSIDNIERASNVIATSEAALQEINDLLVDIQSLTLEAANTGAFSKEETEANQLQIDSAIESITRIANTTSFGGLNLLNGNLDYVTENIDATELSDVHIHGANFGTNDQMPVNVEVLNSAQRGQLFISGDDGGIDNGTLASSVTLEIQGAKGVEVLNFTSGTALSAVAYAVNGVSDATGVSASLVDSGDPTQGLELTTTEFGTDHFVSVKTIEGGEDFQTFAESGGAAAERASGEDVTALVNGNLAVGQGLDVKLRNSNLNLELSLTSSAAQTSGQTYSFDIVGGGASYQIGDEVNTQQRVGVGIQSVAASRLGNSIVGFLSSVQSGGDNALTKGDAAEQARKANDIVEASIDQISTLRGRLGAFERNTLQTTMRSSQIALENLTASESSIRDTDFAEETAKMTRAQVLQQAGTSTLAMANNTSSNVLSLLGT